MHYSIYLYLWMEFGLKYVRFEYFEKLFLFTFREVSSNLQKVTIFWVPSYIKCFKFKFDFKVLTYFSMGIWNNYNLTADRTATESGLIGGGRALCVRMSRFT